MSKTTHHFQAEVKQLLDLVIHSLYSKREIFLRELISNASDAIDKRRFLAITQPEFASKDEYQIELQTDEKTKTLKIKDNGIGMTESEMVEYLGTIARSGTKKFAELKQQAQNSPDLIGQFGVGFYSSFMAASKVMVHSQKVGETQGVIWESEGQGEYAISHAPRPEGPGTTITLFLKEFPEEENVLPFWQDWVIKDLVKRYSNYIAYPIVLVDKEGKRETINSQKAIWQKNPSEVSDQEYTEFYRHVSHDWGEPLKWWHWKAEGNVEFSSILFIPKQKPWNYYMKDYEYGLSLYIKRVFIMDHNKDLLPPYLRFIKGMVDCSDLTLNVSREILQHDRHIQIIKKNILNKVFSGLKEMLEKDRHRYEQFFEAFGPTLKEGIPMDLSSKDKLADLLLYKTNIGHSWSTLDEYVKRMKNGQKHIYYLTGDSLERIRNSPYLERLQEKGFEVLLMTDGVDEWVTKELSKYKDFELKNISTDKLDLDSDEEKKEKEERLKGLRERYENVFQSLKPRMSKLIKDIRLSDRLSQSPSCLVTEDGQPSVFMQKILQQIGENQAGIPNAQRILELNPTHPLCEHLLSLGSEDEKASWLEVLYYQALIAEGSPLDNPSRYNELLTKAITGQKSSSHLILN